jgi:hypothetical protein
MLYSHASLLSLRILLNFELWFEVISELKHMITYDYLIEIFEHGHLLLAFKY